MKTNRIWKTLLALFIALASSPVAGTLGTEPTSQTTAKPAEPADQLQTIESRLDSIFTDAFKKIESWFEKTTFTSSVDLREEKDRYVVRLYTPKTQTERVNAKVEKNTLRLSVSAKEENKGGFSAEKSEQIISLPGPVQADKMNIDRKEGLVVVTLPKANGTTTSALPVIGEAPDAFVSFADFDRSIIREMKSLEGRMNQLALDAFPNDMTKGWNESRLGSAVNLEEKNDKYVIRFYLPERDLANVDVKVDNGQLSLTAKEEKATEKKGSEGALETWQSGSYQQMISLPGKVKADQMRVERKDSVIVVTLPKLAGGM